jgi:hypothetical protein
MRTKVLFGTDYKRISLKIIGEGANGQIPNTLTMRSDFPQHTLMPARIRVKVDSSQRDSDFA